MPYLNGMVKKTDFVRAIDYQKVQAGINNFVIDQIFGDQSELNLKYFSVSLIVFQNFRRFTKVSHWGLNEEEFLNCLKQLTFSRTFLAQIDNFYIPTMEEYEEASRRPEIEFHERDFLVTFLQTGYKQKKHFKNLSHMKHRLHSTHGHKRAEKKETVASSSSKNTEPQLLTDQDMEEHLLHLRFRSKQDDENFDEDKQKLIYRQFEYKNKQSLRFP